MPKTSENGLQFFAHLSNECETAPETIWHKTAKEMIRNYCEQRSIFCKTERSEPENRKWQSDVYIEINSRQVAIEIQRSYQHRDEFFRRQSRYVEGGVECFWLLRKDVYGTLVSTDQKLRVRTVYGGKIPKPMPICSEQLPIAYLEFDPEIWVKGAGLFKASFEDWLSSVLEGRFIFDGRIWTIL